MTIRQSVGPSRRPAGGIHLHTGRDSEEPPRSALCERGPPVPTRRGSLAGTRVTVFSSTGSRRKSAPPQGLCARMCQPDVWFRRRKRCSQRCLRTHTCAGMRTNACSHAHAHAMSRQQHGMLAEARSHARTRGHGSTCSRRFTHARTDTHASTQARTRARAHEVCRHVRIKFACARTHAHTRAHTPQRSTVRMLRDWYRHDRGHRKRARAVHLETDQRIRREVTFPT